MILNIKSINNQQSTITTIYHLIGIKGGNMLNLNWDFCQANMTHHKHPSCQKYLQHSNIYNIHYFQSTHMGRFQNKALQIAINTSIMRHSISLAILDKSIPYISIDLIPSIYLEIGFNLHLARVVSSS
jgi:hypothetical protein